MSSKNCSQPPFSYPEKQGSGAEAEHWVPFCRAYVLASEILLIPSLALPPEFTPSRSFPHLSCLTFCTNNLLIAGFPKAFQKSRVQTHPVMGHRPEPVVSGSKDRVPPPNSCLPQSCCFYFFNFIEEGTQDTTIK